ncbi:hypothetical protein [Erythrobacter mangrovi]|uniref:Globin n=1 Tax=Erythrobacter mangrovi TaxID=2739433 RepID=A0A7D3XIB9_9SPHN|nr:hypothetical protein [Erythrobacter mangrovi]QKG71993.1 hypothetical protein HQR01_11795 [Erythrobacter mangrovi]
MAEDRTKLVERSLTRLAERRGDVTDPVLQAFYARHPDARASFEHHGLGHMRELEGRMVAESVFLLLQWVEDPATARIDQGTAIVHHNDTLLVPSRWYLGMVDAALEVLFESLPAEAADERDMWLAVRADYAGFVESLRSEFFRQDDGLPLPDFPPTAHT